MGKNPRTTKIDKMTLKEESSDTETSDNTTSDEPNSPVNEATDYEKQRKLRIAENNARMEAMGLQKIANSLMKLGGKRKSVVKNGKEDDEYQPSDDDNDEVKDDDSGSSSSEEFGKRRKKKKQQKKEKVSATIQKVTKRKVKSDKQASLQKPLEDTELMDEDKALKQAIALSLNDIGQTSDMQCAGLSQSSNHQAAIASPNEKRKNKIFKSRVQMTEDDVVINFCQFDEFGKGSINFSDLKRMADFHDFTWGDKQLADMIRCFDSDRDGKLSMDDFRNIVLRCNMLQVP